MSYNQPACSLTVTKLSSSGNFLFVFSDGRGVAPNTSSGQVRFIFSVPSADMATFAALTSGNSSTKFYAQDNNQGDYPAGTFVEG